MEEWASGRRVRAPRSMWLEPSPPPILRSP
jgi:hypothetical protein